MKKLFILALALIVASGLFAQVTLSGQVKYGTLITGSNVVPGAYYDSFLRADAKLDDFTMGVLRIGVINGHSNDNVYAGITGTARGTGSAGNVSDGKALLLFNRAYVQSELIGAMGLKGVPVTNTLVMGMNYYVTDLNSGVAFSAISDVSETGVGTGFVIGNTLSIMKMVNVMFGVKPDNWTAPAGGWFVTAQAAIAPVVAEVSYKDEYRFTKDIGKGYVVGAAKFAQAINPINLDAYAAFKYNLLIEQSSYGVAAKVGYQNMVTGQLEFMGMSATKSSTPDGYVGTFAPLKDASWFDKLGFRVAVTPISLLTLDVATVLNLNAEKTMPGFDNASGNMLKELVVGAFLNVNKSASFHFGYLMLGDSAYKSDIAAEQGWIGGYSGSAATDSSPQKGGFFVETKLTF